MAANTTSELAKKVTALVGVGKVREPIDTERAAAHTIVETTSVEEICEIVRMCEIDRITLAAIGQARTLSQIRPSPVAVGVSLKRIARIVAYEPDDMTVVAEAGISVGELNAAIAPARQRLPVDPCDPGLTTLGSLIGASHSGPLRLSEGTSRDLLIGIRFVGHGGRQIHGGGRVVKNVAGYDLMKVMGGSFGTLGIITEVTFKVRPLPPRYSLAIMRYERAADAFADARTLNDAIPLSHLEILSPALAAAFEPNAKFLLFAGFSGSSPEIDYQAEKIRELIGPPSEILDGEDALGKYQLLRDDVAVINCLSITSATTAQEIVRYTGRPKNSISRAVTKLEAEGMLRRKPDQRDGRASTLSLTTKGKRLFDQIKNYFAERDDRLVKVLSDKEKREFNRLLNKISEASVDRT